MRDCTREVRNGQRVGRLTRAACSNMLKIHRCASATFELDGPKLKTSASSSQKRFEYNGLTCLKPVSSNETEINGSKVVRWAVCCRLRRSAHH